MLTVFDVFTPTTQAQVNFVSRDAINDQVVDALRTPGKQVVVYGETGSGKSTLLQHKLMELFTGHVTTRCSAASTFESVLLDAFDQLNKFYTEATKSGKSTGRKASLGAEFMKVKAAVEAQSTRSREDTNARIIAPQLTPQRLGEFLGAEELCWVLEDFHKVPSSEKTKLSQTFKIFSDLASDYPAVKIVAIGATDTAREVVQYDREMANRVAEIHVPLMSNAELARIIQNGGELLNVSFGAIAPDIIELSSGLASICHHLCLNCCVSASVESVQSERLILDESALQVAVKRYIGESSDTLKSLFENALERKRVRKYDNARLILSTLAGSALEGLRKREILAAIRAVHPEYPAANLTAYLNQLVAHDRGQVLKQGPDGRFRFSQPIFRTYAQVFLNDTNRGGLSQRMYVLFSSAFQDWVNEAVHVPIVAWSNAKHDHSQWTMQIKLGRTEQG